MTDPNRTDAATPGAMTPSPPWVHTLAPYVPGKPIEELQRELGLSDIVKLASNENPLGASPLAVEAIARAAAEVNLYPDPGTYALRAALARRFAAQNPGIDSGRIVVGNGSNELITNFVRAFATPADNVVISEFGFVAYRICAGAAGVEVRAVPEVDFAADVEGLVAACDSRTRLMFVANPNNPTGTYIGRERLAWLLDQVPPHVLVVLDEAYFEYVDAADCPDGITLLGRRENLAVMRTFSKAYGLAGCRVGYAVVPRYVATRIDTIREPFDVNQLGQVAALAALDDHGFIARSKAANAAVRARLCAGLSELGLRWWPSQANFVLFESPVPGADVDRELLHRGIICRPMRAYGLPDHLRVTVGTASQNERFLRALSEILRPQEPRR